MRLSRWLFVVGLLTLVVIAGCGPKAEELPALLSPQDAVSRLDDENVVLLDVRTQPEWDAGHADDAILIPLDQLPARVSELNEDDTIIVICRSGNRSQTAADFLRQNGFEKVTEVEGGLRNWVSAGYDLVCMSGNCGIQ